MPWFGGFIALVLVLMLWALMIAPGRTRKLFARLETQGWTRVAPEDEALRTALEALRPFDVTSYVDDGAMLPHAVIDAACADAEGRHLVQLEVHARDAFGDRVRSFQTLALERKAIALAAPVYIVARNQEPRIGTAVEVLGLRRVEAGLDPGFAGQFLVLDSAGGEARLPTAVQQALLASASAFVLGTGRWGHYLGSVSVRLSPSGWTLLVPDPITTDRQMRAFLETADRVSRALA
jgi:hypothetical protein